MLNSFRWSFINKVVLKVKNLSFYLQYTQVTPRETHRQEGLADSGVVLLLWRRKKTFTPTEKLNQISGGFVSPQWPGEVEAF